MDLIPCVGRNGAARAGTRELELGSVAATMVGGERRGSGSATCVEAGWPHRRNGGARGVPSNWHVLSNGGFGGGQRSQADDRLDSGGGAGRAEPASLAPSGP
jgi:hypothetical protein